MSSSILSFRFPNRCNESIVFQSAFLRRHDGVSHPMLDIDKYMLHCQLIYCLSVVAFNEALN